jgi:type I restriction enzyme, S subunit
MIMPGYKQTEVGVIPEEWEVPAIGSKAEKIGSGITPTGGQRVYRSEGRPFIRSQNIGWGNLLLDDVAFIDDAIHFTFPETEIQLDDVFLNITGASIGRSAIADSRVLGGNVNQHVCIIRANQAKLVPRYLNIFLLSAAGQRQIDSFQAGGNRQGLNFAQVRSMLIPIPSTKSEQRAIAEALSAVDGLLDGLERLITKKRDIKQAAMQQLLTGKTRLPGFSGEWEVKSLGEISITTKGSQLHGSESTQDGKYPHLNGGIAPSGYAEKSNTSANTIAISEGGNSCGYVQLMTVPFWCGGHCYSIISKSLDNGFLYHALKVQQTALMELRVGSGLPNVQKTALLSFKLCYPSDGSEQTAIAAVLSDMDTELAALEKRHNKTFNLKQAMMQELLTGKTRLI